PMEYTEIPADHKPAMTYFAALYLQGTGVADSPLSRRLKGELTPGFPAMDPRCTVHVGQSIELLRPPPLESGPGWVWEIRNASVSSKNDGLVFTESATLVDAQGVAYAKIFCTFANSAVRVAPFERVEATTPTWRGHGRRPPGEPDYISESTATNLHFFMHRMIMAPDMQTVEPYNDHSCSTYGGPVLRGLSTFGLGFAGKAIVDTVAGGDHSALLLLSAQFASQVEPGDTLRTRIWRIHRLQNGLERGGNVELFFEVVNITRDKVCILCRKSLST
ncbi:hypothetical protein FB107DRAFT_217062, partial [Schizophyllum commune]